MAVALKTPICICTHGGYEPHAGFADNKFAGSVCIHATLRIELPRGDWIIPIKIRNKSRCMRTCSGFKLIGHIWGRGRVGRYKYFVYWRVGSIARGVFVHRHYTNMFHASRCEQSENLQVYITST
jgi:hypothetical protein